VNEVCTVLNKMIDYSVVLSNNMTWQA